MLQRSIKSTWSARNYSILQYFFVVLLSCSLLPVFGQDEINRGAASAININAHQGLLNSAGLSPTEKENDIYSSQEFWEAFFNSVSMIIATELGDKTFFIAAILAMRYDRGLIFMGALGALIAMTILSAAIGNVLPSLLPRVYTHYCGGLLFLYFGAKLLYEAREMDHGPSDELQEVEDELTNKKETVGDVETGSASISQSPHRKNIQQTKKTQTASVNYKILSEAFTLTFLAEWGDRSQIATIALAAYKNPIGISLGGIVGHAICTGLAVVGGRILAAKISEKLVALFGGCLFIIFGVHSLYFGPL